MRPFRAVRSQRERRFYMRKCLHLSFYMMKYMRPSPELALKALNARLNITRACFHLKR